MKQYRQFIFEDYRFDPTAKKIELDYSLDGEVKFTESYALQFDFVELNEAAVDRAVFALWIMAGVSYYKAALPDEIVVKKGGLSEKQADFFSKTYRLGLGEFFYRNQLPVKDIRFPYGKHDESVSVDGLKGSLVPVGGGKDSIVSVELMRKVAASITTWRVGQNELVKPLLEVMQTEHFDVARTISSNLIELNGQGAYNGHVPITAILSCLAVVCALLSGRQDVAFSNEWSAGEGNVEYQGVQINHQYSKTLEFERDFQEYLANFVTPSVRYFSVLRPLSELRISEIFCSKYMGKYAGTFSSCNRNFKQGNEHPFTWCGECPKCAFVFLVFSPFVPKAKLIDLFGGRNLFESSQLAQTYQELLGLTGHKPFECVGEIQECRQAVVMARTTGEYGQLEQWQFEDPKLDYTIWQPALIPVDIEDRLKQALDD